MPLLHVINVCLLSPVCASGSLYATPPPFPFPSITNQMAAPLPEHGPAGGFFLLNVLPSHFHQVHSHRGPFHCYVLSLLLYCVYFTTRSECFFVKRWQNWIKAVKCISPPIQASPFVKLTMAFAHKNRSGSGKIPHGLDHSLTPAAKRWVSTAMSANAYPQPVGKVCWSPSEWYFTGI